MSDLHIIMPFVNGIDYTRNAIKSIRTQHNALLHIIDNSQTSITASEVFGTLNPRITKSLFTKSQYGMGVAESWNYGIATARDDFRCKYILMINNDILLHPRTVDNLINFMDKTNYAMVTGTNKNDGTLQDIDLNSLVVKDFDEFDLRPITNWREEGPDFSCYLIRPNFVDEYGWFDENFKPAYFEDNDCHTRINKLNGNAKRVSTAPYFHYGSKTITLDETGKLSKIVAEGFDRNKTYFLAKWGAEPSDVLDGKGFDHPFNNPEKGIRWWKGCEKYIGF